MDHDSVRVYASGTSRDEVRVNTIEAVGKEFHPFASQIWRLPGPHARHLSTFCLILPMLLYYFNRVLVRKEVD